MMEAVLSRGPANQEDRPQDQFMSSQNQGSQRAKAVEKVAFRSWERRMYEKRKQPQGYSETEGSCGQIQKLFMTRNAETKTSRRSEMSCRKTAALSERPIV